MTTDSKAVVDQAEAYYDSDDADNFYFHIWGGEDIHIGLYETPQDAVGDASHRTVAHLASHLTLGANHRVLDLGAGYGGAARYLAKTHGCHVTALNLSQTQNQRNRELTAAQGLADRIDVVHGNFEELPFPDASFDVVWSQDAILHSAKRDQVLREAFRVLKPDGELIFTDPMQSDDCPQGVLQAVYDRIHLDSLGSFGSYATLAADAGFTPIATDDLSDHLVRHYTRVGESLRARYDEICRLASQAYVDRMLTGLQHWVDAGRAGHLAWGVLHFRK